MGKRGAVLAAGAGLTVVLAGAVFGALAMVGPSATPASHHARGPVTAAATGPSSTTTSSTTTAPVATKAAGSSQSAPTTTTSTTSSTTTTTTTVPVTQPATGSPGGCRYTPQGCPTNTLPPSTTPSTSPSTSTP